MLHSVQTCAISSLVVADSPVQIYCKYNYLTIDGGLWRKLWFRWSDAICSFYLLLRQNCCMSGSCTPNKALQGLWESMRLSIPARIVTRWDTLSTSAASNRQLSIKWRLEIWNRYRHLRFCVTVYALNAEKSFYWYLFCPRGLFVPPPTHEFAS